MLKPTILKWFVPGLITGAVAGYFYWKFYGCDGTCLITSSPVRSMIYFSVLGAIINSMFKPEKKERTDTSDISDNI
jgi:phage shock protein E